MALLGGGLLASPAAVAQAPQKTPADWARAASNCQLGILQADRSFSVQFRQSKRDIKGATTRILIETSDGSVARLVDRDGHLTADQDAAELSRLHDALASPADFAAHHKRDDSERDYAANLLKLMPSAMIWTYADQPAGAEVHLTFQPDPAFHPPTFLATLLTGLAGRVTLDTSSGCMTHVEGRVIKPVNFGFGVIARISSGGNISLDQRQVLPGRWIFTQLREHLKVRALLFKVLPEDTEMDVTNIQPLPHLIGYQEAIRTLLALPAPTH